MLNPRRSGSAIVEHVQRMLQLIGESAPDAQADAQAVMDTRNRAGQGLSDPCREAQSLQPEAQNVAARSAPDASRLSTGTPISAAVGAPGLSTVVNVTEPKFFNEAQYASLNSRTLRPGAPICAGT